MGRTAQSYLRGVIHFTVDILVISAYADTQSTIVHTKPNWKLA